MTLSGWRNPALFDLAVVFLKLGTIAFGGPAAHIAMMEDEVVRRRRWLTSEEFLDLLGATNLIPGPNSTEMAIHIGYRRAGFAGLLVAGMFFILPAAIIVTALAALYVKFGTRPQVAAILYGIKPVLIAVVVQALWSLGRTAIKTPLLAGIGILTLVAALSDVDELAVLFVAGAVMALIRVISDQNTRGGRALSCLSMSPILVVVSVGGAVAVSANDMLPRMFLSFAKIGSVLFGSGYVLLAFLRSEFVTRLGWLTESQLLDAVAVGQVTPGPVFTTATFIGYILAGPTGALVATLGIFLPAFIFVALSGPLVPRLRSSPVAGAVLDGVTVASLALMAAVTWQLTRAAIVDVVTAELAALSAFLLIRFRLNSTWLVLGGAVVGGLISYFR
jgi:chromate transporter